MGLKLGAIKLPFGAKSDAAADAPARPEPTTMISNRRLLFGFTSFMSKRWWSQRLSIGPEGIFGSNCIAGSSFMR
jgi:hypothetical protein